MIIISYRRNFWDDAGMAEHDAVHEVPLNGLDPESVLTDDDLAGAVRKKRILLLVHGYRNPRENVIEGYRMIDATMRLRGMIGAGPSRYSAVLGVTWPGGLTPVSYPLAKMRANAIADSVWARTKTLCAKARAVDVMTHSLGARVALKAFQNAPDGEVFVRNLFLTAPAVDDESIERKQKFFGATRACERVFVLFSRNDGVLGGLFPIPVFGDGDLALGFKGPQHKDRVGPNVRLVDCARPVGSHSDYRKRFELYTFIAGVLSGAPIPTELPANEGLVPNTDDA
jgi:esterase/lipase superfamily enzyme